MRQPYIESATALSDMTTFCLSYYIAANNCASNVGRLVLVGLQRNSSISTCT